MPKLTTFTLTLGDEKFFRRDVPKLRGYFASKFPQYMRNLNTSHAYGEFRRLRQTARHSGRPADAELLALGLKSYSERGMEYVETIRAMIRTNKKLIEMS